LIAARGVGDFGVELHAVEPARLVLGRGERARRGGRQRDKIGRQVEHLVAVAHPDGGLGPESAHQRIVGRDRQFCPAELSGGRRFDLTAEDLCSQLHPVADAQDRDAEIEDRGVAPRRTSLVHAARTAGQNDALEVAFFQFRRCDVRPDQLAEHTRLADATGNQLGVLRPKIKDRNDGFEGHRK
jgi:hypothetical protein